MLQPATAGLALLLCLAGCDGLDRVDRVGDLRLLGMRAEPPDQRLQLDPNATLPGPAQAVRLTALVADPGGGGRPIQYRLSLCPRLDLGASGFAPVAGGPPRTDATGPQPSQRCLPAEIQPFASGTVQAQQGWVEVEATFVAAPELLVAALAFDPYRGQNGLRLPVQLELSAGAEAVVGTKWVVYALPSQPGPLNENPNLAGVQVGDTPWPAETPYVFGGAAPPDPAGWLLQPQIDAAAQVPYVQLSATNAPLAFNELWRVDFFSTFGGLSPASAGGQSLIARTPEAVASRFRPPAGARGSGIFWFVVRDGRGGTSWLVRQGVVVP